MITIEKGDTICTKDGQTYRVLSTYYNGDILSKIEGIDVNEPSPMRRPVFSHQIARVMKKAAPQVEPLPEPAIEPLKSVSRETSAKKGGK